ncbi:MAG: efflux RND transporter periplasmic adaptor subunit [Rhodobacteraceae bacterium]|nr:efflux RND transporter periplasmic adaptor subunit [Paracoccaceae bacterium]
MHISAHGSVESTATSADEEGLGLALVRARRRKQRAIWIGVALAFATAVGFAALKSMAPPTVKAATVAAKPIERVLAVTGRVRAKESVQVRPKVAGQIVELFKNDGDTVEAGDVLGRIDDARARAALDQTVAAADAQTRVVAQAERDLERARTLRERGSATQSAVENATLAVTRGRDDLRRLQAAVEDARLRLAEYTIVAPADGRVLDRPVDPGQVVDTSAMLFDIAPVGDREIETEVDESYSMALTLGQHARMAFAGIDRAIDGQVSYLSPQIDPSTGGRVVRLSFDLPEDVTTEIPVGLSVDINIVVDRRDGALTVPRASIHDVSGAPYVLLVEGNQIVKRPISFTDWPAADVVVTEGLRTGDRVIVDQSTPPPGTTVDVTAL